MCGICSTISLFQNSKHRPIDENVQKFLLRRGPDANKIIHEQNITFSGCVLWHQGNEIQSQPAENERIILLYNGDLFNSSGGSALISDTTWILNEITKCQDDDELCDFLKNLQGPYSLIFFNKYTKDLYFARDSFGRNSLIIERDACTIRILSTTCLNSSCNIECNSIELPPLGLYKLEGILLRSLIIYPWTAPTKQCIELIEIVKTSLKLNVDFKERVIDPIWFSKGEYVQKESYDFYKMSELLQTKNQGVFTDFFKNKQLADDLRIFSKLLENSVKERVTKTKSFCVNCIAISKSDCKHSKIGILFSGGIDCTILAALSDKYIDNEDSIDLINVAFEVSNIVRKDSPFDVPDRHSARKSLRDLMTICPSRKWNFIEVNVLRKELQYSMNNRIKHLIYPLKTVLDESIGCAFWFASRGIGLCEGKLHKSSARVIIVGSGADELFGGYTRHRNAYRRCRGSAVEKQLSVLAELETDWLRISSRNLGRDDRVIADNGKSSRTPFIEENVVKFVRSRSPCQRCCFALEEGIGDKLFLRLYGYTLGIYNAVTLKKRAIQFGSRIAVKSQNGKDLSTCFCKMDS